MPHNPKVKKVKVKNPMEKDKNSENKTTRKLKE
jgi:hypothetical protein